MPERRHDDGDDRERVEQPEHAIERRADRRPGSRSSATASSAQRARLDGSGRARLPRPRREADGEGIGAGDAETSRRIGPADEQRLAGPPGSVRSATPTTRRSSCEPSAAVSGPSSSPEVQPVARGERPRHDHGAAIVERGQGRRPVAGHEPQPAVGQRGRRRPSPRRRARTPSKARSNVAIGLTRATPGSAPSVRRSALVEADAGGSRWHERRPGPPRRARRRRRRAACWPTPPSATIIARPTVSAPTVRAVRLRSRSDRRAGEPLLERGEHGERRAGEPGERTAGRTATSDATTRSTA